MNSILSRVSPGQWAGLLILVVAIVFVVMNREEIPVSLFGVRITGPAWVILLLVFLAGWLVGVLATRRGQRTHATARH